ncbi:UNVERIFIED_CONTAM: hypothetical protein FKN15_036008 [Acipenser sinensis]
MFGWFAMVIAYLVHYVWQNQDDTRRHLEYLKSLPGLQHKSEESSAVSTVVDPPHSCSGELKVQRASSDPTTEPASSSTPRNSRADVSELPASGRQRPALQESALSSLGRLASKVPLWCVSANATAQSRPCTALTPPAHHAAVLLPGQTLYLVQKVRIPVFKIRSQFRFLLPADIREHVKQIEKAVSGKEPRFVLRALRALPSTSRRLNPNVLHKAAVSLTWD